MKILQVHNFYQQRGGEDAVVAAERELLESYGHEIVQYTRHNDSVDDISRLTLFQKTIFNRDTAQEVQNLLDRESPDIIHAHNTFPLISPSIYYAAARTKIPVVQTLHNYRLLCPAATLFRDGRICEDCVGRTPYPAVIHSCYRGNRGASATAASMITAHRLLGTWRDKIHTYIALTAFSRAKFIEGGLPAGKITVKPNFLARDPGVGSGEGGYALFAGRLSKEKGLGLLIDAWDSLDIPIPLKIAGEGDMKPFLLKRSEHLPNVEFLGQREPAETIEMVRKAAFAVVPSEWYEGLPMTIVEAFACGTPVVTSRLTSMDDLVKDGVNGARFENGSAEDLARQVRALWQSSRLHFEMRRDARATFEEKYTRRTNYPQLMKIYLDALKSSGKGEFALAPLERPERSDA